jgi:uncharacterized phage-associated protein
MLKRIRLIKRKLKKVDSLELAAYILAKLGSMNHLKIHKLIYYIEAYHLAYFNQSIINDNFKAWVHGPVVVKVWHELKEKANIYDGVIIKDQFIKSIIKNIKSLLTYEQLEFINEILSEFNKRSPYELECLTHSETPWIEARVGLAPNMPSSNIISKDLMKKYYKRKLFYNIDNA